MKNTKTPKGAARQSILATVEKIFSAVWRWLFPLDWSPLATVARAIEIYRQYDKPLGLALDSWLISGKATAEGLSYRLCD